MLLCLAACQSNPTITAAAQATTPESAKTAQANAEAAIPEHVEFGTLTVNGKLREKLTTEQLKSQLGRPDSVVAGAVDECTGALQTPTSQASNFWYYGKTEYEVSGTQAILVVFDVTSGRFQGKLGKLVLSQKTTLEDVRRFFPVSAKQADKPADGRPGEEMGLHLYRKGVPMDASLILRFKKGRLQEVEFWSPC